MQDIEKEYFKEMNDLERLDSTRKIHSKTERFIHQIGNVKN